MKNVLLSWSSGKDSAWALRSLLQQADIKVVGLFTSFNEEADRVAMHAVRRTLVEEQARLTGLPLWSADLPWPCSNADYEKIMSGVHARATAEGVTAFAFGDLFLRDIRAYRERQLRGTGLEALFPLWGIPTGELARSMIAGGIKAKITCVDPSLKSFAGHEFDLEFLKKLPATADACGENGEFHTFVYEAPVFSKPLEVSTGEIVERDGFIFADVISSAAV